MCFPNNTLFNALSLRLLKYGTIKRSYIAAIQPQNAETDTCTHQEINLHIYSKSRNENMLIVLSKAAGSYFVMAYAILWSFKIKYLAFENKLMLTSYSKSQKQVYSK